VNLDIYMRGFSDGAADLPSTFLASDESLRHEYECGRQHGHEARGAAFARHPLSVFRDVRERERDASEVEVSR
jgi:hypothetical protein